MSTMSVPATRVTRAPVRARSADLHDPAYQGFVVLWIGFAIAPILFGLDKFFHVLVDWDIYLAPEFTDLFNAEAHTLMYLVGVIEIVAGLVVAVRPRFGGLVAAWLAGIIVNLLMIGEYYDIALRDFGLLLAAIALARLATAFRSPRSAAAAGSVDNE
jgi:hypothetical protein